MGGFGNLIIEYESRIGGQSLPFRDSPLDVRPVSQVPVERAREGSA